MVAVRRSTVIHAPIDQVWAVLRDFNGHERWHPAVAESRIEEGRAGDETGCVRRFKLKDGAELREQLLRHSDWSTEQQTADLRRQIDQALALGYDVLLVRLAHVDLDQLERETGMVASRRQLAALRDTLLHGYAIEPTFTDPVMGSFDRLRRAARD